MGDWLQAIGGLLFFVAGVLPWWELHFGNGLTFEFNAFHYGLTGKVPYVIFVAIAILTIIIKTGSLNLPRILVDPLVTLAAAVVGTVLVGIRFFMHGYDSDQLEAGQESIDRGVGLYLALFAALLVVAGGIIDYRNRDAATDDDLDVDDEIDVDTDANLSRYSAGRHYRPPATAASPDAGPRRRRR